MIEAILNTSGWQPNIYDWAIFLCFILFGLALVLWLLLKLYGEWEEQEVEGE